MGSVKMRDCGRLTLRLCGAGVLILGMAACAPRIDTRGNSPNPERLAEIVPGKHTRGQVSELLGSPSSIAPFDGETWYYISGRTESLAFFAPAESDRQVIIVRFAKNGVVSDIKTLGLEQARAVELVDRQTPTAGNELTILDQLLGNFGRFTKPSGEKRN